MKKLLLVLLVLGSGLTWLLWPDAGKRFPPGDITAPDDPLQTPLSAPREWRQGDFVVTALASYDITARVLSRRRYRWDDEAPLSPVDLLLGWGRMSDQAVIDQLSFKQRQRWGFWKCPAQPPIPAGEIDTHATNTHLLPASPEIAEQVLAIRRGDLVRLQGYLVEINGPNGWKWRSSLSRDDSRGRSCEVFWVESVEVKE